MGPEEAGARAEALLEVWLRAFSGPPYFVEPAELRRVRRLFSRHLTTPGFRLIAALKGGEIVGFAYGFPRTPGEAWTEEVAASLPPRLRERWLRGAFGFVEFAVDPRYQGLGVGSTLHDRLLATAQEPRAVLTVHAHAPAARFYARRGWRRLGWLKGAPYWILGKELKKEEGAGEPALIPEGFA